MKKTIIHYDLTGSYKQGIEKHPSDPDITSEQLDAWLKLQDFVNKNKS